MYNDLPPLAFSCTAAKEILFDLLRIYDFEIKRCPSSATVAVMRENIGVMVSLIRAINETN